MSNTNNSSRGGIGVFGALLLIFVTLKLTEVGTVAHWSWWWVLSPLWGPFALLPVIALLFGLGYGVCALLDKIAAGRAPRVRR